MLGGVFPMRLMPNGPKQDYPEYPVEDGRHRILILSASRDPLVWTPLTG